MIDGEFAHAETLPVTPERLAPPRVPSDMTVRMSPFEPPLSDPSHAPHSPHVQAPVAAFGPAGFAPGRGSMPDMAPPHFAPPAPVPGSFGGAVPPSYGAAPSTLPEASLQAGGWSPPNVAAVPNGPSLTYQVYSARDLAGPRSPAVSLGDGRVAPKPSVALRVTMVLVGICVVFGTAAAVIIGTSDDTPSPKKASLASASAGAAVATETAPPIATTPPPIDFGAASPDDVATASAVDTATPAPKPKPKASPAVSPRPTTPSGPPRSVAPPPNPYGGASLPTARPTPAKK